MRATVTLSRTGGTWPAPWRVDLTVVVAYGLKVPDYIVEAVDEYGNRVGLDKVERETAIMLARAGRDERGR